MSSMLLPSNPGMRRFSRAGRCDRQYTATITPHWMVAVRVRKRFGSPLSAARIGSSRKP